MHVLFFFFCGLPSTTLSVVAAQPLHWSSSAVLRLVRLNLMHLTFALSFLMCQKKRRRTDNRQRSEEKQWNVDERLCTGKDEAEGEGVRRRRRKEEAAERP